MSYLNLAERIRLRFDRKKVGSPTLNSQPGAHTGATRQYIPGYSDSNIVYLDTVSGLDANSGATPVLAKLTYASAATAAGTTKKIRVVNDGAALAVNITKPTEMTVGVSGTIAGSLTTPVDTFTQAGTPSYAGDAVYAVAWCGGLSKFVSGGSVNKIAYSSDGNVWTQASIPNFTGMTVLATCWSNKLAMAVAVGGRRINYSTNLDTWTNAYETTVTNNAIRGVCWSNELGLFVAVGDNGLEGFSVGAVYYSANGIDWETAQDTSFGNFAIYGVCWSDELSLFVAVGDNGMIAYSSDGKTWTQAATPSFGTSFILGVTYCASIGKFVAVGDGKIAYSSDGNIWTQAATPSFGASVVYNVSWSPSLGRAVAVGASGKIAYSSDGNVWTQAGTPSFGATNINNVCWSSLLGKFAAVADAGKLAISTAYGVTISGSLAGFTVQAVQYSGTITAYNCTFGELGTTAALSLASCRVEYDSHVSNNTLSITNSLFRGLLSITAAPSTILSVKINSNTIARALQIWNSSATSFEQIRDNIVESGFYASYIVLVSSGNIRGTRTNTTCTRAVSFSDPVFVDTTDYKLQRVTNGDAQDSPLINASAYYVNEQGQPRDFGAWSYDDSTLPYEYKRSFYLLKPKETGIRPEKQPAASADQGLDGTWDSVNEPTRATEYLTLQYGSGVPVDHITTQDLLESLTDLTCEISLDPQLSDPNSTITVNGNHSIGEVVLNIDASTTIKAGMVLTIGAYKYYILYSYPSTSPTKLILHQALLSSVADNLVITPEEPTTFGTYQYIPQSRQIPRPQSNETEYVNGASFKFVRQYPQL